MDEQSAPQFTSPLVVNANRTCTRIDVTFLRRARVSKRPAILDSGRRALIMVRRELADLVLCGDRLSDMTGLKFLRLTRSEPRLARLPVIITSLESRKSSVIEAIAAGCSGYLVRPYSMKTFLDQIQNARKGIEFMAAEKAVLEKARLDASQNKLDKAIQGFESVAGSLDNASRHYEEGCVYLAGRRYDEAIASFNKAVALDSLFAEAYLGLSEAWQGKGDPQKSMHYMRKAAEAYARLNKFQKARELFAEIIKKDPNANSPFLGLGFALIRQGDFQGAAWAYAQVWRVNPDKVNLYAELARACAFTAKPEHTAEKISRALAEKNGMPDVPVIFKEIVGNVGTRDAMDHAQKTSGPSRLMPKINSSMRKALRKIRIPEPATNP